MADTQQFQNVDAEKWQRIKSAVLAKAGIAIASDVGDASKKGIELSWTYNAQTLELAVTLVKRAWFDPGPDEIDGDIKAWIEAA